MGLLYGWQFSMILGNVGDWFAKPEGPGYSYGGRAWQAAHAIYADKCGRGARGLVSGESIDILHLSAAHPHGPYPCR